MFHLFAALIVTLIFGLPALGLSSISSVLPDSPIARAAFGVLAPVLYALGFVLVAGAVSRPFQRSIVPGSMPRDLATKAYRNRRYYGLCWTAVFYFTPIYWMFLSIPPLKRLLFRLFGYRGTMNFVVYPDTWIRDLPLLEFGEGAYVANKASLGTNVCLNDGTILVDRIVLGRGTMVGHLSMLAPGVVMDEGAEVGVGVAIGMRVHVGADASIAGFCSVNHRTHLDEGAALGTAVNVGAGCRIGKAVRIPSYTTVPNRARWSTQDAADAARKPAPTTRVGAPGACDGEAPTAASGDATITRPTSTAHGKASHEVLSETGGFRAYWNAFE